jgi:hypothetical protein
MPARKIRVELFDSDNNRYTIAFEGQVTRDKALRLLDLVELLGGGMSGDGSASSVKAAVQNNSLSIYEKVYSVIQNNFPLVWFSSKDIQSIYEQELKQPINLSTVSTYLSRMANKGTLLKTGSQNSLKYKTAPALPQASIKQRIK